MQLVYLAYKRNKQQILFILKLLTTYDTLSFPVQGWDISTKSSIAFTYQTPRLSTIAYLSYNTGILILI